MEACSHPERKRHAQLRHQPRATPLWVGDPDHWALVRQRPRPPLVCPEPGCDVELISYENPANQYNPRIFKFKHVGDSCTRCSRRWRSAESRARVDAALPEPCCDEPRVHRHP
jgi:hypothetical protein